MQDQKHRCVCDSSFSEVFCMSVSAQELNRSILLYQKYNTLGMAFVHNFTNNSITSNEFISSSLRDVRVLAIIISKIHKIAPKTFVNFMNLQSLMLLSLPLQRELHKSTFVGLWKLENLYLTNLSITTLPSGIFDDLKELKNLWINENRLVEFTHPQVNLQQLNLANNQIRNYYPSECQDQLLEAVFSNNSLNLIPSSFYDHVGSLRVLDIRGNNISIIDYESLLDHAFGLNTLLIQNNFWYCDYLLELCQILDLYKIFYLWDYEANYEKWNLNGIPCMRRQVPRKPKTYPFMENFGLRTGKLELKYPPGF